VNGQWPSGILPVETSEETRGLILRLQTIISEVLGGISLSERMCVEIIAYDASKGQQATFSAELSPPTFALSADGGITVIFNFVNAVKVNDHICTELRCSLAFGNSEVKANWSARIKHERFPNLCMLVESTSPCPPTATAT